MDRAIPKPCGLDEMFWGAAKENKLLLQRCVATGKYQWYPRARSIYVPGGEVEWVESEGLGKIETYSVVQRSFYPEIPAPYTFAIALLTEGIRMTGHIIETDVSNVAVDMPIRVVFRSISENINLPFFVPTGAIHERLQ